jgi:uncharacterized protein (DUF305 family)
MTPTRNQWTVMGLALAFLAGAIGFLLGTAQAEPDRPGRDSVDVGFLLDMDLHHQQAIQMSLLELRHGENTTVEGFASDIHYFQGYEIGLMERQLSLWGVAPPEGSGTVMRWMGHPTRADAMPGLATRAEMNALGDARGADSDALFVRLMQDHHRGGIEMAEYAVAHAKNAFVRDLAGRMARIQKTEIEEMEGVLRRDGLNPNPPGWTPGPFPEHHE